MTASDVIEIMSLMLTITMMFEHSANTLASKCPRSTKNLRLRFVRIAE